MIQNLSEKLQKMKMQEVYNMKSQNLSLGQELNHLSFIILRREKLLAQLQNHLELMLTEDDVNEREKIKMEVTEAKLLRAQDNLNKVEVEKKRLEQIHIVCQRNPAKNQEWIRNLEGFVDSMRGLVRFEGESIKKSDKEQR